MATEVIHTVKPDGSGNYTLLSGWETAQQRDLVSADEIAVAECYSGQITDNVFLGGWTTDATRRIIIRNAVGHEHGGSRSAGFRITDTTGETIRTEEYALIQGIVILPTNNVSAIATRLNYGEMQVRDCVIYGGGSSTGTGVIVAQDGTAKIWNNVIYGFNGATLGPGVAVSAGTAHVYNNTIANNRRGIQQTAGTCRPKNNLTQDCANACFSGTMTESAANISEDATSPQTGLRSLSVTFVDQANGNYHLAAGDTAAMGPGADLSADANLAAAYDIDGATRPTGAWDIGADQYRTEPVLIHFYKADNTARTATTAATELTTYTVAFADLTNVGLVAGDDVLILICVKFWGSSNAGNYSFAVGFGTTFAGRTEDTSADTINQPAATTNGFQYIWFTRRTLVSSENIYLRGQASTGTASYNEFRCLVLKLGQLTASDFLYAAATRSGTDAETFTTGANANTPAAGKWLLIASARHNVDETQGTNWLAINDGTSDIAIVGTEGENTANICVQGTFAYNASLGSGVNVAARHRNEVGYINETTHTRIFGLRLDAFANSDGAHTANTVTHTVIDTFSEFAGFGSFSLGTNGPLLVMGWPIHSVGEATKLPYGRIQIAGADWPSASYNRIAVVDNWSLAPNKLIAPLLLSYAAAEASGTKDIDLDCAEDADITPNYSCVEQVAVAFSLQLAVAAAPKSLIYQQTTPSMSSMLVR